MGSVNVFANQTASITGIVAIVKTNVQRLASEGLTDKSWTVAVNVFAKKIANMSMDGVIANHPQ